MKSKTAKFFLDKIESPTKIRIALPEKDNRMSNAIKILSEFGIKIIDSDAILSLQSNKYLDTIKKLKFTNNWPNENINKYLDDPFIKSLCMLKNKEVDGVVCGATIPSSIIIRNALRVIGLEKKSNSLSSMFLMIEKNCKKMLSFADCAVIPDPSSNQLSEIAEKTSELHKILTNDTSKIAFLSFSTMGSSKHYRVDNVKKAVNIFSKRNPKIIIEGEVQLDTAIDPKVSSKKIKDSKLKGTANTLIFPNLDAGNIGYKLVQKFGSYYACGPLLLGLNQPVNDLSRGSTAEDIVLIALITAIQAERLNYANL